MKQKELKLKWQILPYTLLADISDREIIPPELKLPKSFKDHCIKLLSIGGERVCLSKWELITNNAALNEGEIINHNGIIRRRGEIHQCHQNCLKLWLANPQYYKLCSGYAMVSDGLWLRHSWLMNKKDMIVETTSSVEIYFGRVLDKTDAEKLWKAAVGTEAMQLS